MSRDDGLESCASNLRLHPSGCCLFGAFLKCPQMVANWGIWQKTVKMTPIGPHEPSLSCPTVLWDVSRLLWCFRCGCHSVSVKWKWHFCLLFFSKFWKEKSQQRNCKHHCNQWWQQLSTVYCLHWQRQEKEQNTTFFIQIQCPLNWPKTCKKINPH